MSAGGRRNGDITEIQGISARKIGQDQGRHVKKSRITTVYTVQRSFINRVTAQFMSRKNMAVLFLASCLAIQVHDITNHIFFFLIFSYEFVVFFSFSCFLVDFWDENILQDPDLPAKLLDQGRKDQTTLLMRLITKVPLKLPKYRILLLQMSFWSNVLCFLSTANLEKSNQTVNDTKVWKGWVHFRL